MQTYQLTNEKLFEDTTDNYSGEDLNFAALSNEKFESTKYLIDSFPFELFNKDSFIGCPDRSDGGGLFIQYSQKVLQNVGE